ncbi:DUF1003 domain-containing protein [Streptomyces roseolilacinus]|uniref:Membrane protein n=1 Tax=Streptomyces roseolilacinus TaxID=66904 RepID=A0A918AV03_9ACTN|nr:DUF1003 domain-containing protein [Streptomyces roseolilacinus]GGP88662.1 membrane protein [Streptomyces roseolilacinus]
MGPDRTPEWGTGRERTAGRERPGQRDRAGGRERPGQRERAVPRTRLDQPLDQPRVRRPRLLPEYDPEAFGRLSERIARFLGTGRFIVWMTVVIITWLIWNVAMPDPLRFDPYPFIFLTLMLSLQASYAAPLILLAQNRQDDRDRVNLEQDRAQNERSIADTEYLTREVAALRMGLGEVATRDWIRSELEDLVKELEDRGSVFPRSAPPGSDEGDR